MAERETKTITTPGGHTIVLKAYLTGREANELKSVLYADLKLNVGDLQSGNMTMTDIPASVVARQEQKAIELLVISVDGATEKVTEIALDLPVADYNAVVQALNDIRNPTTPEK